jgi:SP family general alpha glucoside:H+ symporter-like MFS transporter
MVTPKPTGWAGNAKSGFFYGGLCSLCILWTYFRLPEANGRTYAELDVLFERNVSARKFAKTRVDLFNASDLEVEKEKAPHVTEHQEFSETK